MTKHLGYRPAYGFLFVALCAVCCLIAIVITSGQVYDYASAWSPNSETIAFVCYNPEWRVDLAQVLGRATFYGDIPHRPEDFEICIVGPDGDHRSALTHNRAEDNDPVWSPDNAHIAFISSRDAGRQLYTMKVDGSQQQRLTNGKDVTSPAWSPNGGQIAFSRDGIYLLDILSRTERQLVGHQADFPSWSPDGREIAFVGNENNICQVRVVEADTGRPLIGPVPSACQRLAWSPDGNLLAFVGAETKGERGKLLSLLQMPGGEVIQLTNQRQPIGDGLVWSASGDRIFYVAGGDIFAAWLDGRGITRITNFDGKTPVMNFLGNQNVVMSPGGDEIAFVREEGTQSEPSAKIWKISGDGRNLRRLSP